MLRSRALKIKPHGAERKNDWQAPIRSAIPRTPLYEPTLQASTESI
jgi:hypothetical protein